MILSAANPIPFANYGRSAPRQLVHISGNSVVELLVGLRKVSDAHHMLYLKHVTQPKWMKSRFCSYGFME